MSRTRVQQSQISGSLSVDVSDSYVAADALTRAEGGSSTLVADLNDLRRQLNRIIGEGSWSAALAGEQDLSDIYGAMVVDASSNAEFQADLSVKGNTTLGDAASDTITFTAKAATDLAMDSHKVSGLAQATAAGDALAWGQDASVSDLIVTAGDFQVDADGNVVMAGELQVSLGMTGSAGLMIGGDADFNGSADFQGAVNLQSTLDVAGNASFTGATVDVDGTLSAAEIKIDGDSPAGALYLVGANGEIAESSSLVFDGVSFSVTGGITGSAGLQIAGDMNIDGPAVMNDGLTVSGDRLEVTGSFGLTGAAELGSTLDVVGAVTLQSTLDVDGLATLQAGLTVNGAAADFNADVTANKISIDGDTAQRLYIVDSDGSIKDEEKLTFDGSELLVDADFEATGAAVLGSTLDVTGLATLSLGLTVNGAVADFNADVTANKISIDSDVAQRLYIVDSDGSIKDEEKLTFDGSLLAIDGDLKVGGNDILDSADATVISFKSVSSVASSVEVANNMQVLGDMLIAVSASFSGDVTVAGDLTIQGSMTYIDTENLKVKDTLIHLNSGGGSNMSPRGIVLHGDQAYDDLAFGAKPASGDFVFAKEVDDSDVDAGNSDIFAGAKLAAAWMASMQLGGVEGSLSGSLSATSGGVELSSAGGKELAVSAAADLLLSANGETAISFIESGEWALFDAQFPGQSLVSAIVAAGGNFKQDSFLPGAVAANVAIDFEAALGFELRSAAVADDAAKKLAMDVYLNGVRLAYAEDYSVWSTTEIKLTMATVADDRLLIVVHNAA